MPRAYISQWKSLFVCCWLLLQLYFSFFVLSSELFIWGTRVLHTQSVAWNKYFTLFGEPFCVSGDEASARSNTHWKLNWSWDVSKREMKAEIDNNYSLSEITQKKKQQIVSFFELTNSIWIHRFFFTLLFFSQTVFKMFSFSIQIYSTLFFWNFKLFFFAFNGSFEYVILVFDTLRRAIACSRQIVQTFLEHQTWIGIVGNPWTLLHVECCLEWDRHATIQAADTSSALATFVRIYFRNEWMKLDKIVDVFFAMRLMNDSTLTLVMNVKHGVAESAASFKLPILWIIDGCRLWCCWLWRILRIHVGDESTVAILEVVV